MYIPAPCEHLVVTIVVGLVLRGEHVGRLHRPDLRVSDLILAVEGCGQFVSTMAEGKLAEEGLLSVLHRIGTSSEDTSTKLAIAEVAYLTPCTLGIESESFEPFVDVGTAQRIDASVCHVVPADLSLEPVATVSLDHRTCLLCLEVHCTAERPCTMLEGRGTLLDVDLLDELGLELWAGGIDQAIGAEDDIGLGLGLREAVDGDRYSVLVDTTDSESLVAISGDGLRDTYARHVADEVLCVEDELTADISICDYFTSDLLLLNLLLPLLLLDFDLLDMDGTAHGVGLLSLGALRKSFPYRRGEEKREDASEEGVSMDEHARG